MSTLTAAVFGHPSYAQMDELIDAVEALAPTSASSVSYDNTQSGLTATNVQGAVDELNSKTADELLDKNILSSCDLNTVKSTGIYSLGTSQTYTHSPAEYGVLEVYKPAPSNNVFMIQRLYTSTDMFYRFYDGSAWRDWRKVTATSV